MLFEIKNCTVSEVRDRTSGTSKSGNAWTKATAVVTKADGNYTETIPMLVFGDKIQQVDELAGKAVDVKFSIQSREYNGRFYNDIRLQFIVSAEPVQEKPEPAHEPEPKNEDPDGDLPF